MSRKYKRYSKEFKLEAVRLAESADKPVTEVARELGIRVNQIYKWKQEVEAKTDAAFPGKGRQSGRAAELSQLRKENERLRLENEILKKAAAYFAKELS
jgi:transposase